MGRGEGLDLFLQSCLLCHQRCLLVLEAFQSQLPLAAIVQKAIPPLSGLFKGSVCGLEVLFKPLPGP